MAQIEAMRVTAEAIYLRFRMHGPFDGEGKVQCAYAVYREDNGPEMFGAVNPEHTQVFASVPWDDTIAKFLKNAVKRGYWIERYYYPPASEDEGDGVWWSMPITAERQKEDAQVIEGFRGMIGFMENLVRDRIQELR